MNAKGCFIAIVCLVLLVLLGLGLLVVSGLIQTVGTTSVAGRTVTVTSSNAFGGVAISSAGGKATITVSGHEVRIDTNVVDVVGVARVPIPRDCREIELRGSGRGVRIFFDTEEVPR